MEHGTFLGWIGDDVLHSLYRIADLTVVPSIYEPFGLVALEAMASGCPCIVADTGGLREVVPHEEAGLRFRARDPDALGRGRGPGPLRRRARAAAWSPKPTSTCVASTGATSPSRRPPSTPTSPGSPAARTPSARLRRRGSPSPWRPGPRIVPGLALCLTTFAGCPGGAFALLDLAGLAVRLLQLLPRRFQLLSLAVSGPCSLRRRRSARRSAVPAAVVTVIGTDDDRLARRRGRRDLPFGADREAGRRGRAEGDAFDLGEVLPGDGDRGPAADRALRPGSARRSSAAAGPSRRR